MKWGIQKRIYYNISNVRLEYVKSFYPEIEQDYKEVQIRVLAKAIVLYEQEGKTLRDYDDVPPTEYDYRNIFLMPEDKLALFRHIERRCIKMLEAGLVYVCCIS